MAQTYQARKPPLDASTDASVIQRTNVLYRISVPLCFGRPATDLNSGMWRMLLGKNLQPLFCPVRRLDRSFYVGGPRTMTRIPPGCLILLGVGG